MNIEPLDAGYDQSGPRKASCLRKLVFAGLGLIGLLLLILVGLIYFTSTDVTNLTPADLTYELAEPSQDGPFVVAGKNSNEVISKLESLAGIPIGELETKMRPGFGGKEGSKAGFLGKDERLIELLVADNEYVVNELKLSHQELARPLLDIGYFSRSNIKPFVQYRGGWYFVSRISFKGLQHSPFSDDTSTDTDVTVRSLLNGRSITYSLLVPHMIHRYGFYEGHGTSYRVDPQDVVKVFGLRANQN